MANTYASLGDLFFGRGSWDKAIEYFNASRQAFDELGDIHSMALVCSNLSGAYVHKGEWEKGIELCRQSLQILERLGDRYGMAAAYNNLGAHYRAIGNTQQAATYVAQAYLVLSSLGAAEARQSGQHLISILGSVEAANAFLTHFSSEQITLGQEFEQADQSTALDQLLDAVINACQSDAELGEQLFDFTRDLAADPAQPPDLRALGRVLQRVLAGERAPDLSDLPAELASAVQAMLARLA
jgi:tetratricopeptide (TPR) repeat protein